ncbi:hypothetical protein MX850_05810 [Erysipelothrix sp. Poltava]|nr:hypothetical protein MX850_05810 [Erysipelothrix sp. Poltava]
MQSKLVFAKQLVYEAGDYVREHMKEELNIDTKSLEMILSQMWIRAQKSF